MADRSVRADGSSLYAPTHLCEMHTEVGSARPHEHHCSLNDDRYLRMVGFVQLIRVIRVHLYRV